RIVMATSEHDGLVGIRDVICGSCQAANHADRRYCGSCGQRLWEPCVSCRTPNATDQQYCGHCGLDLHGKYQQLVDELRSKLNRCEQLRHDGRYSEALAILERLPASGDTRLQPLYAQAETLSESLTEEWATRREEAAVRLNEAQTALADRNYRAALHLLE